MPSPSKIRSSSSSPAEAGPVVEPSKILSSSSSPLEAAPKSRPRKLVAARAMPWPHVLTVAGSDSGVGAGIQADIKACAALGAYCSSVITAVTAQNTVGVQGVHAVPEEFIEQQLNSVLSDMSVDVDLRPLRKQGGSEPPQSSCQKFEDMQSFLASSVNHKARARTTDGLFVVKVFSFIRIIYTCLQMLSVWQGCGGGMALRRLLPRPAAHVKTGRIAVLHDVAETVLATLFPGDGMGPEIAECLSPSSR